MKTLTSTEVEDNFARSLIGTKRTPEFQESILVPVTVWLNNSRKRTSLAFDASDGVTSATMNRIRRTAMGLGHSVRLVVKTETGDQPTMLDRKHRANQSLVIFVKYAAPYGPRSEREEVATAS